MIQFKKNPIAVTSLIAIPIRIYLGVIFLQACIHKILDPAAFALDVASYQLLPLYLINLFAIVVPVLEASVGLFILLGLKTRSAALLIAGMMVLFIIALVWALWLGLEMSCGCFSSNTLTQHDPISGWTLVRDSIWFLLAVFVAFYDQTPMGLDFILNWKKIRRNLHG